MTDEKPAPAQQTTLFECGPVKCDHDYSGPGGDLVVDGRVAGWTAICSKCGASAYEEAQWQ